MPRDLVLDFRQGGGSVPEIVHGIVRIWGTEVRPNAPSLVLTTETTLKLTGGKATLANAQTSGTGPLYEWAYIIQVEPFHGRNFRFYVAIPDGTTPINLVDLPKINPYTGEGFYVDIAEWEDLYGDLPSRVDAAENKNTSQDTKITELETRPGGIVTGPNLIGNLNTYVTTGFYQNGDSTQATLANNYPAVQVGVLTVRVRSSGQVLQTYETTSTGTPRVYRRHLMNGVWTAWVLFASTRVDTTVGTRIFTHDGVTEHMVKGETGPRKVGSVIYQPGVVTVSAGEDCILSRSGDVVNLFFECKADAWVNGNIVAKLPIGFRPWGTIYLPPGYGGIATAMIVNGVGDIRAYLTGNVSGRWNWTWTTKDAWPTTLPGTPA